MIRRLVIAALSLLACHLPMASVMAQPIDGGLIPVSVAQQYGLERAWYTQARLSPARVELVYLKLHVSTTRSQTIFRVTDQYGMTTNYSERHLDVFGQALGVEGAQKAANEKVRLLKLNGVDATVEQNVVPDITLYFSSSTGIVQAADAETGLIRWTASVGRSDYHTTELAASDELVATVNGQNLYVLRADDGTAVAQRRVAGGTPATGPAIAGMTVFVPTLSGELHAYRFGPDAHPWTKIFRSTGAVQFPPTAIGDSIVWPTDAGVVTAIDPTRAGAKYRLQFDDPIAGPLVYSPPARMLAVTNSGYLYSFDVKSGAIRWRYSTGDATAEPASVVGSTAYLVTRNAGMRAIDTATGAEKWWARDVAHFVAATKNRVYTTTTNNVLTLLDVDSGQILAEIPLNLGDKAFVNNQTDRIYIGTETGLIQCLREQDAYWPTVHVTGGEFAAMQAAEEAAAAAQRKGIRKPADGDAQPTDPFAPAGAGRDPFAKPAAEPAQPQPAKPQPDNPFEDGNASPPANADPAKADPAEDDPADDDPAEADPAEDSGG